MAGGAGVEMPAQFRVAASVQPEGKGSQELGIWEMEVWVPPAAPEPSAAAAHLPLELESERSCSECR